MNFEIFQPRRGFFENEGIVQPKSSCGFEGGFLRCAVDEQLSSYAGVAIYPFAIIGGEMAAEVREPLLERVDVVNFRLITAENRNDVVEDLGIKVLEKERVEISQLIERVELVDDRLVISPYLHIELFDMLDVQVFPELIAGLGQIVFGFKISRKCAENTRSKNT